MTIRDRLESVMRRGPHQVLAEPHATLRLLVQNAGGRPAVVIELDERLGAAIGDMRGIELLEDWPSADEGYLRIASTYRGVSPGFVAVVQHVLDQAARAEHGTRAIEAVVQALEELRDLFGRKRGRLGEDAIRGLYAELLILERLLDSEVPAHACLLAWHGPFGGAKDFVFSDGSATEVKSSHRPAVKVAISNVDQLEPAGSDLSLVVIPLERELGMSTRSITALAIELGGRIAADANAKDLFADALEAVGLDLSDSFYEQWSFKTGDELWFEVSEMFPRIRSSVVELGVSAVRFDLEIAALADFATDPRF